MIDLEEGAAAHAPARRGSSRLEVELDGPPFPRGEARVILLPGPGQRAQEALERSAYPWSRLGSLSLTPGSFVGIDDLPAGELEVLVLHARGAGRSPPVRLDPRVPARVRVALEPGPTLRGRVTRAGEPAAGARVLLLPVEPVRAAAIALGRDARLIHERPLEALAAPPEEVVTDRDGRFELGRPDAGRTGHSLVVTCADGSRRVVRVERDARDVAVELQAGFTIAARPGD